MASEIKLRVQTGLTLYALVLRADGQVWNGAAFESLATANWGTYDIALVEQSTTGIYYGTFPAVAAGIHNVLIFKQVGGSPATTDPLFGQGTMDWDGTRDKGVNHLNDLSAAQVNTEVDTALADVGLTTTITGRIDTTVSSRLASASYTAPDNATIASIASSVSTLLARIGAFTGSGVNTILGFFQALFRSNASTPSDVGGTFDPATDSVEAIRDRGDIAWLGSGDPPSAAAIADAVWDESGSDHTTAGSTGALLQILSQIANSAAGELDTTSTPYLTAAEFLKRADLRVVAMLCSDTSEAVATGSLASDPNLAAALIDASGFIEAAVLMGGRYTSAQLQALTGAAKGFLQRLVARLTVCLLYERRIDRSDPPWFWGDVMNQLEGLANGTRVWAWEDTISAGHVQLQEDTRSTVDDVREGINSPTGAQRFFGSRLHRRK